MQIKTRWANLARYLLTSVLGAWPYIIASARSEQHPLPWEVQGLLSLRFTLPLLAAAALVALQIYTDVRYPVSKALLKEFLDRLHEKYFPYSSGGSDPNFRVTLFTPGVARRWLLCIRARSGGLHPKSRMKWNVRRSEAENYHGIAGNAWATGIFVHRDGLPNYENCSPAERLRYLSETFITEKDVLRLNWKARSYRALVVRDRRGEKVGVLMMESKLPEGLNDITARTLGQEAEYLQFLLSTGR